MSDPMPMIPLNFDARTVEPSKPFEPLPTAWYDVRIIAAEAKPTSAAASGTDPSRAGDYYMEITEEVISGPFQGRKVFDRLNLKNANPTAQEIAWKTLSAICHATGVLQVRTIQDLFGHPMQARVVLKPARTVDENGVQKTYDASNDVKGYKACEGNGAMATPGQVPTPGPMAGGPPAPAGGSPPWANAQQNPPTPAPQPTLPPAPAAPPPPASPQPRINPPQPYQEGDVVIQPGAQSGFQLKNNAWVPWTPPVAAPPAPPAPPPAPAAPQGWQPPAAPQNGGVAPMQPQYTQQNPPPVTAGGPPWGGAPTSAPPPPAPSAPNGAGSQPPWAKP